MYPVALALIIGNKSARDALHNCLRDIPVRVVLDQAGNTEWTELESRLEQTQPDLLIIDVSAVASIAETFALVRSLPQPPVIAALHTDAAPDAILNAVRAGASDFLYPPFEVSLRAALARLSDERQKQKGLARHASHVVGVLSAKGGCGATTVACHVAVELPRHTQQRVLLADLDFDAGLIAFLMKTHSEYSVWDAIKNLNRMDLSFWKKLVSNGHPGLEVLTAPSDNAASGVIGTDSIASLVSFTRRHYDWILLDLGRGTADLRLDIPTLVDEVLLLTTMEIPALHLARTAIQRLRSKGMRPEALRVVINRIGVPDHPSLTIKELETVLAHDIFATLPNDYASLQECYAQGQLLANDTCIRRHLSIVARRIAGLPEEKPRRRFSLFG